MLARDKHKVFLVKILKSISDNATLRSNLGFKGGTAAYLFYNLPRFSVDLDFDLQFSENGDETFAILKQSVGKIGEIVDEFVKRHTYFLLLRYEKGQRNIKIDISQRRTSAQFTVGNYLGIPLLLIQKESMAAGKLAAFLERRKFASRDAYDLWFFLKEGWDVDEQVVYEHCAVSLKEALRRAVDKARLMDRKQLLQGLGELLDEKQKAWAREKLKDELVFQLRLRLGE
jgi:predicted nucleotidyltransferase component of viral defense system